MFIIILLDHLYVFSLGLLLGSFFNVVGLRVPVGESIVKPRSHCPSCQRTLTAWELIPVVSYLVQMGRCRGCGARISPLYPLMEWLTACLFTLSPLVLGWSAELLVSWTLISLFMIIVVSDLRYMMIPDRILLVFAVLFLIERALLPLSPWWDSLVGAFTGFVVLLFVAVASRGGMGGGDIKLFALIGFVVGWKMVLLAFFISTLYGTVFGLIGMALGKVRRGQPMPFGPYIALGTLTVYFFGHEIVEWYKQLIFF